MESLEIQFAQQCRTFGEHEDALRSGERRQSLHREFNRHSTNDLFLRCIEKNNLTAGCYKQAGAAGGFLGMVEGLQPSEPISGSAHELPFSLPRSLDDAIRELRECEPLVRILGEPFIAAYTIVKEAEYEVFLQVISSWEREHLLLNV